MVRILVKIVHHVFCYRQYLLYYGNDPTSSPTVLPMGNYELDFLNQVKLYIFDNVGDYYIFTYNLTVCGVFCFLYMAHISCDPTLKICVFLRNTFFS